MGEICIFLQFKRPAAIEKNLKCTWVHHNNPYLQLGPFKFELKHQNPEVTLIHDLVSSMDIQNIQDLARGKMKSTPYLTDEDNLEFSKDRTSKVMYMNENLVPQAMVLSQKIELATRFTLSNEIFASENFQIMNYGIGGKISAHTDSIGINEDRNEHRLSEDGMLCKFKYIIMI